MYILFSLLKRLLLLLVIKCLRKFEILLPEPTVCDGNYAIIWFYDLKGEKSCVYVPYLRHAQGFEFRIGNAGKFVSQHPNIPLLLTKTNVNLGKDEEILVRTTQYDM